MYFNAKIIFEIEWVHVDQLRGTGVWDGGLQVGMERIWLTRGDGEVKRLGVRVMTG